MSGSFVTTAEKLSAKAPNSILSVYGLNHRCLWASPSHERVLGYTPEEMIGQHWQVFVAPEDHPHAHIAGSDTLFNGRSIKFTLNVATRTGVRIPMKCQAWIAVDRPTHKPVLFFQATPTAV